MVRMLNFIESVAFMSSRQHEMMVAPVVHTSSTMSRCLCSRLSALYQRCTLKDDISYLLPT